MLLNEAEALLHSKSVERKGGLILRVRVMIRRFYSSGIIGRCKLPSFQSIPLAFEKFNVKDFKQEDSRNVLFLHGFLGSKKNYKTLGKHISRSGFNVYGVDMRNHGESEHALPFDYQSLAKDVEDFIHREKLDNLVIIGHLMGAKVAMLLTLLNPKLVSSLVVVDNTPSYTPLDASFTTNLRALQAIEDLKISASEPTKSVLSKINEVFTSFGVNNNLVRTFLLSNLAKKSDSKFIKFINPNYCFIERDVIETVSEWPSSGIYNKYDGPVLVVRSTQSGFIPTLKPFETYFKNFKLIDFDASHYIVTEKGKEFTNVLMDFLKDTK